MTYRSTPLPNEIASAVSADDSARVKALLDRGASLGWRSGQRLYGLQPYREDLLDVAFDAGALAAARVLLDAGMRLHPSRPGHRPNVFHLACKKAHTGFIRLCVETRKCSALAPRCGQPSDGRTPLAMLLGSQHQAVFSAPPGALDEALAQLDAPLEALLAARPVTLRAADASEMLAATVALGVAPEWLERKILAHGVSVDWASLYQGEASLGIYNRLAVDLPHPRAMDWLRWLEDRGVHAADLVDRQPEIVANKLAPFIAGMQSRRLTEQPAQPPRRIRA